MVQRPLLQSASGEHNWRRPLHTETASQRRPVDPVLTRRSNNGILLSMYVISPIRIQNLLQMRVREGYRSDR